MVGFGRERDAPPPARFVSAVTIFPGGMMSIRTLVVDDEPMARERIVGMLAQEPDVHVVGECSDGNQAVSAIQNLAPDLVFLDVQMPAADGFGVLRQIKPTQMPMVVFVTAYNDTLCRRSKYTRWITC